MAVPIGGEFALVPAETQAAVAARVGDLADRALAVEVTDQATYDLAGQNMLALRAVRGEIVKIIKPFKDDANARHKAITGFEKLFTSRIDAADSHSEQQQIRWEREQKKIADAKAAEQARLEAEAKKQAEAAALESAVAAEASGDTAKAGAILAVATAAPLPVQGPKVAAVEATPGLKTRQSFSAILDPKTPKPLAKLLAAIAAGLAPADCVMLNQKFVDTVAESRKAEDGTELYPGVVCKVEEYKQRTRGATSGYAQIVQEDM